MRIMLIKKKEGWYNLYQDSIGIGSTHKELQGYKLSLKNCKAIELGYDLDELADEYINKTFPSNEYSNKKYDLTKENAGIDFIAGLQKALELMGDKKFSEEDIKDCWEKAFDVGYNFGHEQGDSTIANEDVDNYIQSLQQKEWDVEVEMIDYGIGNDEDGRPVIERKPLLDADGCLILKSI